MRIRGSALAQTADIHLELEQIKTLDLIRKMFEKQKSTLQTIPCTMTYRRIPKEEALKKLNETVRTRLHQEGLDNVYFRADDTVAVGDHPAIVFSLTIPDTVNPSDFLKAQRIADEEMKKFLAGRYYGIET